MMHRGRPSARKWLALLIGASATFAAAPLYFPLPAHAMIPDSSKPPGCQSGASSNSLAGSTATANAIGAQVAFNLVPGPLPLTGNLVEDDLSFARATVSGPQASVQAAPYYPGDIAANLSSLLSLDGVESPVGNDPAQAFASYPPSPAEPSTSRFPKGKSGPSSSPVSPKAGTAIAHAGPHGASATATVSDLKAGSRSADLFDVGRIQSSNKVVNAASCLTAFAESSVGGIDIGGIVHIASVASQARATTNGKSADPSGHINVGKITVNGLTAALGPDGIHVLKHNPSILGLTPVLVQKTLDKTLGKDGILVKLLKPTMSAKGGEGKVNSGALVITFQRAIYVPYIPGEPTIPVPGLGNTPLPSGLYNATTTLTLGSSIVDANATAVPPAGKITPSPTGSNHPRSSGSGTPPPTITGSNGTPGSPGAITPPANAGQPPAVAPSEVSSALQRFIPGLPVAVGWVLIGVLLCLLTSYQLLIAAWSQLVKGRG